MAEACSQCSIASAVVALGYVAPLVNFSEPGMSWLARLAAFALGGDVKSTFGGTALITLMMGWPASGQAKANIFQHRFGNPFRWNVRPHGR